MKLLRANLEYTGETTGTLGTGWCGALGTGWMILSLGGCWTSLQMCVVYFSFLYIIFICYGQFHMCTRYTEYCKFPVSDLPLPAPFSFQFPFLHAWFFCCCYSFCFVVSFTRAVCVRTAPVDSQPLFQNPPEANSSTGNIETPGQEPRATNSGPSFSPRLGLAAYSCGADHRPLTQSSHLQVVE